jgi:hypothetical protein
MMLFLMSIRVGIDGEIWCANRSVSLPLYHIKQSTNRDGADQWVGVKGAIFRWETNDWRRADGITGTSVGVGGRDHVCYKH